MQNSTKLLLLICLPIALWTAIFFIQVVIGRFMPPMLTGALAAFSGVAIGSWVARQ